MSRGRVRASTLGFLGVMAFLATFGAFVTNSARAVGTNPTTTTLASNANPAVYGQSVTLTAAVAPVAPATATPTGTVTFLNGVTTLATRSVVGGTATYTTTYSVGTKSITARYNGDTSYAVGTSAVLTQVINVTPTATTVTANANPTNLGNALTFTAIAQATAPGAGAPSSGSIKFYDGTTLLASRTPALGIATFTTSTLAMGTHNITASFFGSASYAASASTALVETVNAGVTTTTVSSSANPSVNGSAVVITATVASPAGTPTGTVVVSEGASTLGSSTLTAGQATVSLSGLAVGTHPLIATYSGAGSFLSSTSSALAQIVDPVPTTTALASTPNPSAFGAGVSLTATVTAGVGNPTGTVTFSDGSTSLGSAPLNSGVATLSTSALSGGSHDITAAYSGNGSHASSTSATLQQAVNPASTTTTIDANANPTPFGSTITFTTTVSSTAGIPTGTVAISDGVGTIGTATLTGGAGTFTTSTLGVGSHSITASYNGTASFASSTSSAVTEVVNPAPTTTALSASVNPAALGDPVTLTATVVSSPLGTSGTVTFSDDGSPIGTASVVNGSAAITTTTLTAGTHSLTADYGGDADFASSSSGTVTLVVNGPRSIALTSSANPSTFGGPVTFTATVTGVGTPTGIVTFLDGLTTIGSANLSGGSGSLAFSSLSVGSHLITADYAGDAFNPSATSTPVSQVVDRAATSTEAGTSQSPSIFGQTVDLTATVTSSTGTPTGTVSFTEGATTLGSTSLTNGVATLGLATLPAGSHSIAVAYSGDASFTASTAPPIAHVVSPAATTTASGSSPNPSALGSDVTIIATVASNAGTPTGSVIITDGASVIGTPTLANGVATLTVSNLAAGTHSLVTTYSGSANFATSAATPITQSVIAATTTALASSTNPAPYHQSVTLTATVTSGAGSPTGTVHFFDGATDIGSASVSGGDATLATSLLAGGSHSLTATYSGDSSFSASTSAGLTQTITPLATTSVASATPNRIVAGQLVTVTATVTAGAGTPTGLVTFREGATVIGTATLDAGQASVGVTNLTVGAHALNATYGGDGNFASSSAATSATILDLTMLVDRNNPACSNTAATAGSAAIPFCAINSAATKVSPGQTVQVAAGTYPERVTVAVGGSAGLPVTFSPAPGSTVTLSGLLNGFTMTNKSWVTIHGFAVDHTSGVGIVVSGSSNITIDANHVTFAGQPVNGATAVGIKVANTTNSSVTNNVTDHNSDAGILITNDADNMLIAHNESFANARVYTRAAAGIDLRSSTGALVYDNRTYDNEDSGINVWTGLTQGGSTVSNNIVYSNGDHGIDVHNAVDARVVANTVVGNADSGIEMTGSKTATLNNNITIDNGINSPRTSGNIRADKSSVNAGCIVNDDLVFLRTAGTMIDWFGVKYPSLSAFRTATGMESRGIEADPLFASVVAADFHLLPGSPAIDSANTDVIGQPAVDSDDHTRFDVDTIPDIGIGPVTYADRGAFEYRP